MNETADFKVISAENQVECVDDALQYLCTLDARQERISIVKRFLAEMPQNPTLLTAASGFPWHHTPWRSYRKNHINQSSR